MEWYEVLVQQTINGLTRGAVFALIALGYTMVYGIIELINFAHGDVFMLGLFLSLTIFTLLGMARTLTGWELVTILPLVFLLTMLLTGMINVTIDRLAYRPLRRSPRLAPLITAIGVSFVIENLAMLVVGPAPVPYPDVFPSVDILYEWLGWDTKVFVTTKDLLVVGATVPLMIVLQYFVTRTGWGRAMRATAQDRETAESMGINVEKTILLTFFIGGALAGAGGTHPGPLLQHRHLLHRVPGRAPRVHGRGAGRHREHARRRARRDRDRLPVGVERPVHLGPLDQRHRLLHPHPRPGLPPAGAPGRADAREGLGA